MMAQLLGREYTAIKDIKTTCATCHPCEFLILVPVQCIIEKKINSERIDAAGIFGSSRTTSVAFDIIPGHVEEECRLLKFALAQGKVAGGNTYVVIWTSKMKEHCSGLVHGSSCHFGRGFLNDKSLRIVIRGGEPLDCGSADQPHGPLLLLLGRLFANPHLTPGVVPLNAAAVMVFAELLACPLPCMRFLQPITCLQQGSVLEEDSPSLQKLLGRDEGDTWSSLPVVLLWMIKDRLDFFDNVEVALVCHHWQYASINYPTKMQTVGDGIPWIMQAASVDGNKCVREFISIERRKKFAIELPEFYDAFPLFSKQGWILFMRSKKSTWGRQVDSLFLINPLTKGKIDLPDVVIEYIDNPIYVACFSTNHEGVPNCVVLSRNDVRCWGKVSFYITYPGCDQVWTELSYIPKRHSIGVCGLAVINSRVYCCSYTGAMIVYDMAGQTWKYIPPVSSEVIQLPVYLMELQGHLALCGYDVDSSPGTGCFFKYSDTHNSWQQLASDDDDANNLSMFGTDNHNYLLVRRQRGLSIHRIFFQNHNSPFARRQDGDVKGHVVSYDILESSAQYPDLPYTLRDSGAVWVDIG